MKRKLLRGAALAGLLGLVVLAVPDIAGAASKFPEVVIRNTDAEPVPTKAVGTTPVSGSVSVDGTTQVAGTVGIDGTVPVAGEVSIAGRPTVAVAPTRAHQEYLSFFTEQSSICESYIEINEGNPILLKKLYIQVSQFRPQPPSLTLRATVISENVWPDHIVQTLVVGASTFENGQAVFDFGEEGLYLDADRMRARTGDAVALYLGACQHYPDSPHEITGWQGLAVGYLQ